MSRARVWTWITTVAMPWTWAKAVSLSMVLAPPVMFLVVLALIWAPPQSVEDVDFFVDEVAGSCGAQYPLSAFQVIQPGNLVSTPPKNFEDPTKEAMASINCEAFVGRIVPRAIGAGTTVTGDDLGPGLPDIGDARILTVRIAVPLHDVTPGDTVDLLLAETGTKATPTSEPQSPRTISGAVVLDTDDETEDGPLRILVAVPEATPSNNTVINQVSQDSVFILIASIPPPSTPAP